MFAIVIISALTPSGAQASGVIRSLQKSRPENTLIAPKGYKAYCVEISKLYSVSPNANPPDEIGRLCYITA